MVLRVLITGGALHLTVSDNLSRRHLKNISKWFGSPRFESVQKKGKGTKIQQQGCGAANL
jgi:hypothetical protein